DTLRRVGAGRAVERALGGVLPAPPGPGPQRLPGVGRLPRLRRRIAPGRGGPAPHARGRGLRPAARREVVAGGGGGCDWGGGRVRRRAVGRRGGREIGAGPALRVAAPGDGGADPVQRRLLRG